MTRALEWLAVGRRGLVLGLAAFALLLALGWVGFLASDDVTYARGAYGWIEHFPFVGGHGTIRYPITIPMALSFLALGGNEFAMVLPSLAYIAAFLALAWKATRDAAGPVPALGALAALVTSPLLVIQSTIAGVDVIELAFLFGSFWLVWQCLQTGPDAKRLFLAGVLAGLAFLTRETAIFVVPFYAVLFLAGHRFHRAHYLWIAAGFLAVWSLELIYLGIMTGDPLYRFTISLHHDSSIDRSIDLAGNALVNPVVDPLLVLLVNQEFMLLFFMAIPLGAWLCFGKSVAPKVKHFARLVALFGLSWWVCVGAAQHLLPLNPRYFMITAAMACLLTGLAIGLLLIDRDIRKRGLGIVLGLVLVGSNLAGIYVENRDPVYGEHVLADLTETLPGRTIVTDPMTRYRSDLLLHWNGNSSRVTSAPPAPGQLYYYNPDRASTANFKMPDAEVPLYQPRPEWERLRTFVPPPSYLCRVLEATGLAAKLPPALWQKLRYRHSPTSLYLVR